MIGDAAHKKLIRARSNLLLTQPFFGSLCLRMDPKADSACRTAWTDGRTFAYNPAYVANLDQDQVCGLVAHTVMHPACQHHTRRNGRDHGRWNMACDYAINWLLLEAGMKLPPGYLDDSTYHGMTADEIYAEMKSRVSQEERPFVSDQDAEGDGEIEWDDAQGQSGNSADPGEGEQSLSGASGEQGEMNEGSSGDDNPDDSSANAQSGDPGGSGEVRDGDLENQGGSTSETENDDMWELALAQAAQQAREVGDLPGGLERLIESILNPTLDWRELLSRYVSERVRDDYSWTPPNKRFLHLDVVLPSLSHRKLPDMVLAIDTSGSVTSAEMDQFAAELSGLLEVFDTTVHVVYCDSKVTGVDSFTRCDLPLSLSPTGGGGTDFCPVFTWVEEEGLDPACLVYLTDLECLKFPSPEPDYPVLWAQVGNGITKPPFGDIVQIC